MGVLGWPRLRRHLQNLDRFDLVHCWSVGALSLAALFLRSIPRVVTLTVQPSERTVRWLRLLVRESPGPTVLLPISSTIKRVIVTGGAEASSVHVLRPGIDMGMIDPGRRDALRAAWKVRSPNAKVIAVLGDCASSTDTLTLSLVMSMICHSGSMAGMEPHLVLHPDQTNRERMQKAVSRIGLAKRVILEPRLTQPWEVLPGCDVALALGRGGPGLSLLWAMAGNVPIVGEAVSAVSEIVEDRHSALLAQPDDPRSLAQRILMILSDPQLAWKLRDTARHEAYSFFSRQRYCQSLGKVYGQVVEGRNVEVPAMESTGGLRFTGRA